MTPMGFPPGLENMFTGFTENIARRTTGALGSKAPVSFSFVVVLYVFVFVFRGWGGGVRDGGVGKDQHVHRVQIASARAARREGERERPSAELAAHVADAEARRARECQ